MSPKSIVLSLSLFLITIGAFGQQPTDDEVKKAISGAIGIANAINAQHGVFITPGEYVVVDGKLVGQKYTENSFAISYRGGNAGLAYPSMMGDKVYSVILESSGCQTQIMDANGYVIEMSSEGLPVKVTDKTYARYGKGFVKKSFVLEYAKGKLVKVLGSDIKAEGKSSSSANVTGEQWWFVTEYNWSSDGKQLQVVTKRYGGVNKKGNEIPGQTSKTNYTYGENSLTIEKFQSGTLTEKWDYLKNEKELRLTQQFFQNNQTYQNVCAIEDGKVVKQEHWEYGANNSFIAHSLLIYTYELKEPHFPKDNLCNYKTITESSIYNTTGEVIEERKGGQFRRKNPDGTWGEWTYFRM